MSIFAFPVSKSCFMWVMVAVITSQEVFAADEVSSSICMSCSATSPTEIVPDSGIADHFAASKPDGASVAGLIDSGKEGLTFEDAFAEAAFTFVVFLLGVIAVRFTKRRHVESKRVAKKVGKVDAARLPAQGKSLPVASAETPTRQPPALPRQKSPHARKSALAAPPQRPQPRSSEAPSAPTPPDAVKRAAVTQVDCPLAEAALAALASRAPPDAAEGNAIAGAVRRGKAGDLPRLLAVARQRNAQRGLRGQALEDRMQELLVTAIRACASARCFKEGLAAYDHESAAAVGGIAPTAGRSSSILWSVLLYVATECKEYGRCKDFYKRFRATGAAPSGNDLVNLVRALAHERDIAGVEATLEDLKCVAALKCVDGFTRNRAVAACCAEGASDIAALVFASEVFGQAPDVVTFNTLMKDFARQGQLRRCLELREEMRRSSVRPSEVTFGILLDACLSAEDFERACEICKDLLNAGLRLNSVHCTSFVKGLVGAGRLAEAAGMLEQMERSPDAKPDIITYSTLVKAYAERGEAQVAAATVHRMISRGIQADEIIFNSALAALSAKKECRFVPSDVFKIFEGFLGDGLQPTTTTVSIILKALTVSHAWTKALDLLETLHERFGLQPECRLFAQLAQAALRENRGDVAEEAIEAMQRSARSSGQGIDEATRVRLLRWATSTGQATVMARLRHLAPTSEASSSMAR